MGTTYCYPFFLPNLNADVFNFSCLAFNKNNGVILYFKALLDFSLKIFFFYKRLFCLLEIFLLETPSEQQCR